MFYIFIKKIQYPGSYTKMLSAEFWIWNTAFIETIREHIEKDIFGSLSPAKSFSSAERSFSLRKKGF